MFYDSSSVSITPRFSVPKAEASNRSGATSLIGSNMTGSSRVTQTPTVHVRTREELTNSAYKLSAAYYTSVHGAEPGRSSLQRLTGGVKR